MAKKRTVIGSVVKNKESGQPDYIKIKSDVTLKAGQILNLDSKERQLTGVDIAMKNGKLSEDLGNEIKERINKMPDFVRFEIVMLEEKPQQ